MYILSVIFFNLSVLLGEEVILVDWGQVLQDVDTVLEDCPALCTEGEKSENFCNCEESCENFGDCCVDYPHSDYRNTNVKPGWSCLGVRVGGPQGLQHYNMIDSCPPNYKETSIISKCSKDVENSQYTYNIDLPVVSSETERLYANIFCAICNNDSQSLNEQSVGIMCDNQDLRAICALDTLNHLIRNGEYVKGELRWDTSLIPGKTNCTDQLYVIKCWMWLKHDFPNARSCDPTIINTCKDGTFSESLFCTMYKLPVKAEDGLIYYNPHCATCNAQPINKTTCISPRKQAKPLLTIFLPSLSILLDFTGKNRVNHKCDKNQFYDNLLQRCYSLSCGFLYENMAGKCEKRNISEAELNIKDSLGDCFMVSLNEWEVDDEFENGSIVHKQSKTMYHIGEYEIYHLDGKDIFRVCSVEDPDAKIIKFNDVQAYLSTILTTISLFCLFFHIIIYSSLKKLRNQPSKNLMSLACSLFVGQLLFFYGFDLTSSHTICLFVAISSHYFILVSFFCMNIMSYDICRTFISILPFHAGKRRFKFYSYYCWGIPSIIVLIAILIDNFETFPILEPYKPEYATRVCWLNNKLGSALFFVFPVAALLLENFLFFLLTIYGISSNQSLLLQENPSTSSRSGVKFAVSEQDDGIQKKKSKVNFVLYLKISVLMGLSWLFGLLASVLKCPALWYPFIVFNSLQGSFIFIFFDLKWKVYYVAYEKLMGRPHPNRKYRSKRKICFKFFNKPKAESENTNEAETSTTGISASEVQKTSSKFERKGKLVRNLLRWTKPEPERKIFKFESKEDISKYSAWQQLEIFRKAFGGNKEPELNTEDIKNREAILIGQACVKDADYDNTKDKSFDNWEAVSVKEHADKTVPRKRKKKRAQKQTHHKVHGELAKKKSLANENIPPPPYRHPPPYQSGQFRRKLSYTTIIQHTVFEDDFEKVKGFDKEKSPGPIVELASSSSSEDSDKEEPV